MPSLTTTSHQPGNLVHLSGTHPGDAVPGLSALAALHSTTFATAAEALDAYLSFVMHYVGVRSAFIAHLDSHFMHVLHTGDDAFGVPRGVVPLQDTFCQYVRATGTPIVVPDAARDPRFVNVATREGFTIGSYLGVPIICSNGVIYGTLCAVDPHPHTFRQTDIDFMRIAASHIALLIEREHRTRADHDTTRDVSTALDALDAQTALLKVVAHDIRNPLGSIQGYVEMLQRGMYGPLSHDQQEVLAHLRNSAQFINRLAVDLLDAAAADGGMLTVLTAAFDPCQLAQSVLESCRTQAAARGHLLQAHHDANIPMMIGDSDRLRQILLNFMGNAIRYTFRGRITLRVTAQETHVQFSVEDTGPGISAAAQASIWRLHSRNSSEPAGFGLGLYIVQRLAQAMNGTVGMQSVPGQGSTFWVRLPLQGPPSQMVAWNAATQPPAPPHGDIPC